jgi:hypothetical protein
MVGHLATFSPQICGTLRDQTKLSEARRDNLFGFIQNLLALLWHRCHKLWRKMAAASLKQACLPARNCHKKSFAKAKAIARAKTPENVWRTMFQFRSFTWNL